MATNCVDLDVSAERAFQLLEDPRSLRLLVVGAQKIRRFDPRWPEIGSEVHHSVGIPPLVLRDTTVVTDCIPSRRLVLEARTRVVGTFRVHFELVPRPYGCALNVEERAIDGPCTLPAISRVADRLLGLRNAELCRRFQRLIERRERVAGGKAEHG